MIKDILKGRRIILCSASPRRKELLTGADIPFEVDTQNHYDESYPPDTPLDLIPEVIARGKSHFFHRALTENEILLTADTIVRCGDRQLGKPADRKEALEMLELLSGKTHRVTTGVCIRTTALERSFSDTSEVSFRTLEQDEMSYYVDRYRPFDKAGGYGIQEWIGYVGITGIQGSYFNIVGLPIEKLYEELLKLLSTPR